MGYLLTLLCYVAAAQYPWALNIDPDTQIKYLISDDVFDTVQEMEAYMQNRVRNETVVIKTDPI